MRSRKSKSTSNTTATKSTGPYDRAFQQHLIDFGIYPDMQVSRRPSSATTGKYRDWRRVRTRSSSFLNNKAPSSSPASHPTLHAASYPLPQSGQSNSLFGQLAAARRQGQGTLFFTMEPPDCHYTAKFSTGLPVMVVLCPATFTLPSPCLVGPLAYERLLPAWCG